MLDIISLSTCLAIAAGATGLTCLLMLLGLLFDLPPAPGSRKQRRP
jgi:hypothetical protein